MELPISTVGRLEGGLPNGQTKPVWWVFVKGAGGKGVVPLIAWQTSG